MEFFLLGKKHHIHYLHKMRYLVLILLSCIGFNTFSQVEESFAIKLNGDTVYLYKEIEIDVHAHPQTVLYRNELNERQKLLSTELSYLEVVKVNYIKNEVITVGYSVKKLVSKTGFCTHFVGEVYRVDDFAVFESPYCQSDDYLILYIENEEGNLISINNTNYHEIIDKHFSEIPGIDRIRRKRYSSYKLRDLLVKNYLLLLEAGKG